MWGGPVPKEITIFGPNPFSNYWLGGKMLHKNVLNIVKFQLRWFKDRANEHIWTGLIWKHSGQFFLTLRWKCWPCLVGILPRYLLHNGNWWTQIIDKTIFQWQLFPVGPAIGYSVGGHFLTFHTDFLEEARLVRICLKLWFDRIFPALTLPPGSAPGGFPSSSVGQLFSSCQYHSHGICPQYQYHFPGITT